MTYDVYYYRGDDRLPDYDTNVSEYYVETLPKHLRPGETAYARCHSNSALDYVVTPTGCWHPRSK
jgi:hypothetical protein